MIIPGLSTACFYPEYTENVIATYLEHGVAATEIFVNAAQELEPQYLSELKKAADGGGMRILSLHPYQSGMEPLYFFSNYDRRFAEGMEAYKRYYQAANLLGADIVVFHGAMSHQPIGDEEYFHRFGLLMEDAARYGVRLCQENVVRCKSREAAFFARMSKALPNASYVLDTKQAVRAGESLADFVACMDAGIAHVHISDHHPQGGDCLNLGSGVLNIDKFLMDIGKTGFDGGIVVELYRQNFTDIVDIMQGYQLLCTRLSTVFPVNRKIVQ